MYIAVKNNAYIIKGNLALQLQPGMVEEQKICKSFCVVGDLHLHSCSYLQYSGICARLLRQALKPEYRASALKREESLMKVQRWKDGQPGAPG